MLQRSVLPERQLVQVQSTHFWLLAMTVPGKRRKTSTIPEILIGAIKANDWNIGEQGMGWGFAMETGDQRRGKTFAG